jgi:hypothetical protein
MVYDDTGMEARWLMRMAGGECPGPYKKYHHAKVRIENGPMTKSMVIEGTNKHYHGSPPIDLWLADDRWPVKCDYCQYVFSEDDADPIPGLICYTRRIWTEVIYRRPMPARANYYTHRSLPIGAMYDAPWHRPFGDVGPDGLSLTVQLPPGYLDFWCIDGKATNGGRWTRTGTPPNITANPSIATSRYHGFLHDGVLSDCLADKTAKLEEETKRLREYGMI